MSALAAGCDTCDAVCCRQLVVLQREDRIPAHLTARTADGCHVMARDEEGWCVAVAASTMRCSIYATRPGVCRSFAMDGPCCRALRSDHATRLARGIPLAMH